MSNIIQIGEWTVRRQARNTARAPKACDHTEISLDANGHVVRCVKCGDQLSAFWALEMLSEQYNRALAGLEQERAALAKARETELQLSATRKVEQLWRGRKLAPACPHCGCGILPEDGLGSLQVDHEYELRRRTALRERRVVQAAQKAGGAGQVS